jgi:PTH1 family peptidyl-tRNA hydrolase
MSGKLLAGLGNPGAKYLWTRHNAGFMVLDRLAQQAGASITKKAFSGLYGETSCWGNRLHLLKPQTFMNLSGQSVSSALRYHKLTVDDLIVIHDDLDIPFGQIKIKKGGGHGGHNGLRSLLQELGSGEFTRIRIGIDRSRSGDPADYVLSPFSKNEMTSLSDLLNKIVDSIEMLVSEGLPKTMSLYNNKDLLAL